MYKVNVLAIYEDILRNAGEDPSQVISKINLNDSGNPTNIYACHTLEHRFSERDFVGLDLMEDVEILPEGVNKITESPLSERNLSRHLKLDNHYWVTLSFVNGNRLLEQGIELYVGEAGGVIKGENGKSFIAKSPKLRAHFSSIDTSIGANFRPVVEKMVEIYQDMRQDPSKYMSKAA